METFTGVINQWITDTSSSYDKLLKETLDKFGIMECDYDKITTTEVNKISSTKKNVFLDGKYMFTIINDTIFDGTKATCNIYVSTERM
jgi:hypothetical protein